MHGSGIEPTTGPATVQPSEPSEDVVVEMTEQAPELPTPTLIAPRGGGLYALVRFDDFVPDLSASVEERMASNPLNGVSPFVVDMNADLRLAGCQGEGRWTPPSEDPLSPPDICKCTVCIIEHHHEDGSSFFDFVVFDTESLLVAPIHTVKDGTGHTVWLRRQDIKLFEMQHFRGEYESKVHDPSYAIQGIDVENMKGRRKFAYFLTDLVVVPHSIVP